MTIVWKSVGFGHETIMWKEWNEDEHPRNAQGEFGEGGASASSVNELVDRLTDAHPGIKLDVSEKRGNVAISRIVIPKEERNSGTGSAVLRQILAYADAKGLTASLSPSTAFGGSKAGLERLYGRLGFKPNKGRTADLSISDSWVRQPDTAAKSTKAEGVEVVALHEILPSAGIVWKSVGFGEERILWKDFLKEWDSALHPRGPDGRFGDGDGVNAVGPPLDAKSMTDEELKHAADPAHHAGATHQLGDRVFRAEYADGTIVRFRAASKEDAKEMSREYGRRFLGGKTGTTMRMEKPGYDGSGGGTPPTGGEKPAPDPKAAEGTGRPEAGAKPDNTVGKEVGSILAVTQTRQFENDGQYGGPKEDAANVRSAILTDRDSNVVRLRLLSMSNTLNDRADRADKVADTLARVGDRKNEDRVRAFSDQCRAASATARDAAAQYDPDVYGRPAAADIAAEKACRESSAAQNAGDKMAREISGERQAALTAPDRVTTGRDYGMQSLAAQAGDVSKFSRDMAMGLGRKGTLSETEARATAESHINTAVELGAMAASAQLQQLSAQRDGDMANLARLRDMEHSFRQAAAAHKS